MLNVHDEEPDQVYDRLRRDADQDRWLIADFPFHFHNNHSIRRFLYMTMKNLIKGMTELGRMRAIIGE